MKRSIQTIVEQVEEDRRLSVVGRKRALPDAPFIAAPPARWKDADLSEEIAELFSPFSDRYDEVLLEYDRRAARQKDLARERRAWASGLERAKKRETDAAWRRLMLDSGRCVRCSRPRGANGTTWLCATCRPKVCAYMKAWRERNLEHAKATCRKSLRGQRARARAAGKCVRLCGRPIRSVTTVDGRRKPALCETCAIALRERMTERRALQRASAGVIDATVNARLKRGWEPDRALAAPVKPQRRGLADRARDLLAATPMTRAELSEALGATPNEIRHVFRTLRAELVRAGGRPRRAGFGPALVPTYGVVPP